MYDPATRHDYTLADAFHALGIHLYGDEWIGYEILGERAEDPSPALEARAPLGKQLEEISVKINQAKQDQKEALGRKAIFAANMVIRDLENDRAEVWKQLQETEEVRPPDIADHARWERFLNTEDVLLRGLGDKEIEVYCSNGRIVPTHLWAKLPEEFSYDFERSVIFWPAQESSIRIGAAKIREVPFEAWVRNQIPLHDDLRENVPPIILCRESLKTEVRKGGKAKHRDEYKAEAMILIPGLSHRAFLQVWAELAPDSWKGKGRPRLPENDTVS